MENLKIYKSALALVTATSILLLCGCNSSKKENKETSCTHLTVYFENKPVTFKECEGYDISTNMHGSSSEISYTIKKDNLKIISGTTTIYNKYHIYHNVVDELLNQESAQKTK